MYKLCIFNAVLGETQASSVIRVNDGACIPFDPANTDYQTFKTSVLDQQPNTLIDNGDSFSMSSDESILKDADGNSMTIEQAKTYVRTLP